MAYLSYGSHTIRYELSGPETGPAYVLVNGLTQYAELWGAYRDALVAKQFRVVTFDLLGQGESDKPSLFISQDDHVAVLRLLIDKLGVARSSSPVSASGVWSPCAMRSNTEIRWRAGADEHLRGTFAAAIAAGQCDANRIDPRRHQLPAGHAAADESRDAWLAPLLNKLDAVKRQGWLVNDVYALQNLMESFLDFEPLTPRLGAIRIPTMILNGEFDFLTPRALHDSLRIHIPDSALVIIPRGYHAFTLEKPALTADLLATVRGRRDGEAVEGRRIGLDRAR